MIQEYIESYDVKAKSKEDAVKKIYSDFLEPDDTKSGNSKFKSIELID
mgnify:CR=1 FL=1